MSKVMRSVKNVTKGYSSVQVKVREATSNDPWGPTGTQMSEIAQMTYNSSTEFYDIVDMLDKRLNDKGKNWRHVLKALKVLDYCLHEGSELVVTWSRKNIYIIKTLREFVYIDEEGRDVGQNGASFFFFLFFATVTMYYILMAVVRVAAKELTALILDEERLRAERSDRKTWKSRVTGIEEFAPATVPSGSQRQQRSTQRHNNNDEEDAEYRLAIEASKYQEEEDRRKREGRQAGAVDDDDDLAKAIKLSREEDERRKRELEENNASSLFDIGDPTPSSQAQPTGMNMGYQQGNNVDWLGNPIDQSQFVQSQPTGFVNNAYPGYPNNNGYPNGFGQQPTGVYDPYSQQNQSPALQMQPTGYNPYVQQAFQSQPTSSPEPVAQPGSNNPWASNNNTHLGVQSPIQPMQTGSNNPFASTFARPSTAKAPSMPTLNTLQSLPEQKTLQTYTPPPQPTFHQSPTQSQLQQQQLQQQQSQRPMNAHEQKLNALLASGDGMDTFGNTGDLRIPAQHTAPGTFVNSAGAGAQKLTAEATGNNPFLRTQYTGMPQVSYNQQMPAATGPAMMGMNGYGGGNNPFAARPQQQNQQAQDLIQF
ncbi:ENTH domain-containing protein [Xylaria venustula]|nr:ENTH domain-containing protein [Xylaria venustula]